MEVNIKAINELITSQFNGNQTNFSKTIGIERTHLNKVLKNNGKGAGSNFCGAIMRYCNDNGIDYNKYIILP